MSDYEFPKYPALCALETGIEVRSYHEDRLAYIDWQGARLELSPQQARHLSDALLEAASIAESGGSLLSRLAEMATA